MPKHKSLRPQRLQVIAQTLVLGALVAGLAGCFGSAHDPGYFADHLYLDSSEKPCEGDDHQIEIIQGKPDRPYRRIAHVQASSTPFEGEALSWGTLRRHLCREAAVVGADAIIDLTMKSKHFSRDFEVLTLELAGSDTEKLLIGVAIRFDSSEKARKSKPNGHIRCVKAQSHWR